VVRRVDKHDERDDPYRDESESDRDRETTHVNPLIGTGRADAAEFTADRRLRGWRRGESWSGRAVTAQRSANGQR